MLQLKTPLSSVESDLLLRCLTEMEDALKNKRSSSHQDMQKRTALASARQKLQSHMYDSFHRDEITNMVFALDLLSRKYNAELTELTPYEKAAAVGIELRTAAAARSKLMRAAASRK